MFDQLLKDIMALGKLFVLVTGKASSGNLRLYKKEFPKPKLLFECKDIELSSVTGILKRFNLEET